ncbi:hypothetical protein F503_00386 [Ophiostoma piceae UAMH 11346]|uniref:Uncharacterized protein n=1 Tax=Ophiostoma piceae (strain UAMH 11346) TaxID=1262450 RepID=S3C2C6_OPHP1|nr:hypothetical protein F503_00386 [Ophiostoma piceae UAMH 11346]
MKRDPIHGPGASITVEAADAGMAKAQRPETGRLADGQACTVMGATEKLGAASVGRDVEDVVGEAQKGALAWGSSTRAAGGEAK